MEGFLIKRGEARRQWRELVCLNKRWPRKCLMKKVLITVEELVKQNFGVVLPKHDGMFDNIFVIPWDWVP